VLLLIGVLASRRMHDIRDYYAGGKKLGFINVAFSARATGESAWLLLGVTGTGFAVGLQGLWIAVGELLGPNLSNGSLTSMTVSRFPIIWNPVSGITVTGCVSLRPVLW